MNLKLLRFKIKVSLSKGKLLFFAFTAYPMITGPFLVARGPIANANYN